MKPTVKRYQPARYLKCALQVNPFHYKEMYRGEKHEFATEHDYNVALIEEAKKLDIQVLAVTDHNHVGSVQAIADLGESNGIAVFPGFEVESSEGVHLLCIFERGTTTAVLERYLGELGIDDTDHSTKLSSSSLQKICEMVAGKKGLTIAAHITENKGLLHTMKSQAAIKAWRDPNLNAGQITTSVDKAPQDKKAILENKNPAYKREHCPSNRYGHAFVNCKDIAEPADLGHENATCYIKMSNISIEGLKQAFLDPDSRIRLNSDPKPADHAYLLKFQCTGGFLDGLSVDLSSDLNVLIGGRGTGKSSILEAIRYILNIKPLSDESAESHNEIVKEVIKYGSQLSLLIYSPTPSPKRYLIERTPPNQPQVKSEDGKVLNLKPSDVLSGIEIFGQHEVGGLTRDPTKITSLLERFVEESDLGDNSKAKHLLALEQNRVSIAQKIKSRHTLRQKVEQLPAANEELERFKTAGVEEKLEVKGQLIKEESAFKALESLFEDLEEQFEQSQTEIDLTLPTLEDKLLDPLPGKAFLSKARKNVEDLGINLENAFSEIRKKIAKSKTEIEAIQKEWTTSRKLPGDKAYLKLLKELQTEAIDADAYVKLKERIELLSPEDSKLKTLEKELVALYEKRKNIVDDFQKSIQSEFSARVKAAKKVSKKLQNVLKVELNYCGDKNPLLLKTREIVGGRLSEFEKAVLSREDFSLTSFIGTCRKGAESIEKTYKISKDQAHRIAEKSEELCLALEELELPHTTKIELNIAREDTPEWRSMSRLSKGQKATALLLLLLQESNAPLIIDQPEDDLDNQFIADGIVPRMRAEKQRRQFIFSSHNANLPVLGDAELILSLSADGEAASGKVLLHEDAVGSIDTPEVQRAVETILEGGRIAFETRRKKYGF